MRRKEILKQTIVIVLLLMIAANPVAVINAVNYDNTNAPASAETIYSNSEANVSAEEINAEADVLDGNHRTFKNYWSFLNKSEWRKFAKLDGDFAELVIGVNAPYEKNYNSLISMIRRYCGQVKDKIVMKNEVRAVVASFPFDNVPSVAEDLPRTNAARYVEPNMKISADFVPNDPDWDFQWGPQKIEADYAWNTTMGSHSVLIAIIDTGVDYTHPDLAANYVPVGYDFVNDDADPMDDYGHGTHCAGIAAAVTNNAIGIAGVAQVGVMAEKGLNAEGFGYEDDLAQCIIHAVDQGADVLSNSWGGDSPSQAIEDAIKYACSNGVLVFASAGNTATRSKHYPAAQEEVIAVTATDAYDAPAYFTTYGDWVEISAPGVAIYSTLPRNNYEFKSGTSMSCPHAAGVAALILSRYPDMSMTQRRQAVFYATDDTGDVGFDIYHGYGRINARKGVEEIPIDVDLAVWSWSKPPYVEPGDTGLVNATIYNFGASELNDIMVKLMANGSVVNEQVVSHLSSDSFANTTLEWTPEVQGRYNLTVFVVPVLGETNTRFNVRFGYVDVGFPRKIAIVDSWGTDYEYIIYEFWQRLNEEWRDFGDQMIYVDFTSLNKYNITYEDIKATEADVLFISNADPREYSDEEIDAIYRYVYEGHGLITTMYSFTYACPNNKKLAPLLGLNKFENWNITADLGILNILDPTHPLFRDIPAPLNLTKLLGCYPEDDVWDADELWGGTYIALEENGLSAIVAYRGLLYISPDFELAGVYGYLPEPDAQTNYVQLFYNAMVWSEYQTPEHELTATLKAPGLIIPSDTAYINVTVSNLGLNDESNVTIQILINGSIVYSYVKPTFDANYTFTINYPWKPTSVGTYNVTAFVKPVAGEDNAWNNKESTIVVVIVPPDILLVAENMDPDKEPSLEEFKSALDLCGTEYYVWEEKLKGSPQLDFLKQFELVIWTVGMGGYWQITDTDASKLVSYAKQGGKILLDGDFISVFHYFDVNFIQYVTHGTYSGMTHPWLGGTDGLKVIARSHLVTWSLPEEFQWGILPGTAQSVEPMYGGFAILNYIDNPEPPYLWDYPPEMQLPSVMSWKAVIVSEKNGIGSTMFCPFAFSTLPESSRNIIVKNALNWFFPKEHELTVTVKPFKDSCLEVNRQANIEITVSNWGLESEINVELNLYIDGIVADSEIISSISPASSYTHNYAWTPNKTGTYNITAHVMPVLGEDLVEDNIMGTVVNVRRLLVALVSDQEQLEIVTPILESMGLGSHIYSYNKYYGYAKSLSTLQPYKIVIFAKSQRKLTSTEYNAIKSYLAAGGNLLATDKALIDSDHEADPLMSDIVCASYSGMCVIHDPADLILYVINGTHPITDGAYGTFPTGYTISNLNSHCENVTANATKGAIAVAKWVSPTFPADKIVATNLNPGRVAYWNGEGHDEWTRIADCQTLLKNMIVWLELGEFHDLSVSLELPDFIEPGKSVTLKAELCNVGYFNEDSVELRLAINSVDVAVLSIQELARRTLYTLEYNWVSPSQGIHSITAYSTLVPQEINQTNNVCSTLVNVYFLPHIVLIVPENLQVDQTFSLNITILNATNLCEWELELYYRNYVLNGTSIAEGSFLNSAGPTMFEVLRFSDAFNATHGLVHLRCHLTEPMQGVNGSGILATISFEGLATGICYLTLQNTKLTTLTMLSQHHFPESGTITIGLLGDLNDDGIIDIFDVVIVSSVYGSKLGNPSWNPQADVVPDGVINIFDIVKVTSNYGKTGNP